MNQPKTCPIKYVEGLLPKAIFKVVFIANFLNKPDRTLTYLGSKRTNEIKNNCGLQKVVFKIKVISQGPILNSSSLIILQDGKLEFGAYVYLF